MRKHNFFYITMTRREQLWGWAYLAFQTLLLPRIISAVLLILFPEAGGTELNLILFFLNFLAVVVLFRRFWLASFRDLDGRLLPILWKSVLLLLAAKLAGIVMNDFIYFYCPQYFLFTDTGPVLITPNDALITQMAQQQYVLMAIATVFLVPPVEELLHRGVVFGSIYPKSPVLAVLVSTLLFTAVHMIGYAGMHDTVYFVICLLQYIPPALCLCWLYTGTDSIFAPILMHMLFNAMGILSVR